MAVILWYLLRLHPGEGFAPVRFIGYIAPLLLIFLVPGCIAAWFGRKKRLSLLLIFLVLLVGLPYAPLFLPRIEAVPQYSGTIKVMSFSAMGRNRDYASIAGIIRQYQPDIFFVQETGIKSIEKYLAGLYGKEPIYSVTGHGGFVASRYPLRSLASSLKLPMATAETPYGNITLWGLHAAKAINDADLQFQQISKLRAEVVATVGPKIVAGDFNTTDKNVPYKIMDQYLDNAHWQAGWGFGFTFPTKARRLGMFMPFLRIDHIFYSEHLYALEAETLDKSGGSDHLPITALLAVKKMD